MVDSGVRGRGCNAMWWNVAAPNVRSLLLTYDTIHPLPAIKRYMYHNTLFRGLQKCPINAPQEFALTPESTPVGKTLTTNAT